MWRSDPGPGIRPKLHAGLIVEIAIAIADEEGLAKLSMQRVSAKLGYTTMALYRHVPSKTHLVAAMTDTAYGAPPAPPPGEWRVEVEAWVEALWQVYRRHPWLLQVPTLSAPIGPRELDWFEALLRPLSRAGLGDGDLLSLATFISSAVRDIARISAELDPAAAAVYADVLTRRLSAQRFPILSAMAASEGPEDSGDPMSSVRFGLRLLLDGIDAQVKHG